MIHSPDYQEFSEHDSRIKALEREVAFIKSRLLRQCWLSRSQAVAALNVSETTLWRLTQAGRLPHRYEGTKPLYCVEGIRQYLNAKKIGDTAVDERVLSSLFDA